MKPFDKKPIGYCAGIAAASLTLMLMLCCPPRSFGVLTDVANDDIALSEVEPPPRDVNELAAPFQRGPGGGQGFARIYKDRITPHWLAGNSRFWYRNDLRGGREFVLVDAERGTREPAFDHEKLAAALSKATGDDYPAKRLPFDEIEFVSDGQAIRFKVRDTTWRCDLTSYECTKTEPGEPAQPAEPAPQQQRSFGRGPRGDFGDRSPRSPDGKWTAFIKDGNVFIREREGDKETQLSHDGKENFEYGMLQWSPDSQSLIAFRIEPGERKEVHLIESSPREGGRAKLQSRPYALPGDKFTAYELNLFAVGQASQPDQPKGENGQPGNANAQAAIRPKTDRIDFGTPRLRWRRGDHRFTYQQVDRGHQRFRLIEVDARTGATRNIIDEKTTTFIWTAHTENVGMSQVNWLEPTEELIYVSERDGWRHLYLIDARPEADRGDEFAAVKHQITRGEFVVRGIDRIDEEKRQIWFRASGRNPDQDPYFMHYYRVNFDGTGLVALTAGNGAHSIQFSPDRRHIIDTYSRVDQPPVHELRRVADGTLVCKLDEADISELVERGWHAPEVFVAKGRDGKTDIWGIISRPKNFDPVKKYPIIESVYAGPQGSFVPKTFSQFNRFGSLTDLGFVVVQSDGMGTANRSKAFHDVCWHNLSDGGFPDRKLWIQTAAEKYPHMDVARVGVYGTSAGGQNAMSAVLLHPDFYKVAVAACGCHDNRMDKASWNEQWMGFPVGPHYAENSNVTLANRLQGKLFLIVGELDNNVPPESTLRVVDALIKAEKDFDLLVVPGGGHGMGGAYGTRRMQDFFVRHLLGVEPPNRNVPRQAS